ncbi:MAG: type II secretion system secretin GspD [Pseudomonadota bacterium]
MKRIITAALLCAAVSACASFDPVSPPPINAPASIAGNATRTAPRASAPRATAQASPEADEERLQFFQDNAGMLTGGDDVAFDDRVIDLAFVNAPVLDVVRAVVGDVLGETVIAGGDISGAVTVTSNGEVSGAEALRALETALSENNLALQRTPSGFVLTSLTEAQSAGAPVFTDDRSPVGFSAVMTPVLHTRPSEVVQLVQPFVSQKVAMTALDERGVITLRGPSTELALAQEAIAAFDAPYLTDRTFGMFKLLYADAETVRGEIETVMRAAGAGASPGAELIALPRQNLLFVTSRTREGFLEARSWVERLDRPSGGDERRLRYYVAQNTPAEVLADQVSAAFGALNGGGRPDAAAGANGDPGGQPQSARSAQRRPPPTRTAANGVGLGGGVTIATDELNNALILRATDQEYREIIDLVQRMDVSAPQVLIEATIAEVTLNDDLAFGVRWSFQNAESQVTLADNVAGSIGPVFPGLSYTFIDNDVQAALDTLASVTDVTVLSAPSIMVLNNQTANLQVGDEVPVVTQTAQAVVDGTAPLVSTVQLRETGVILEVRPRINASGVIVLEVTQEVSDAVATTVAGIETPTIQQRRFTSTVAVPDNGTVALGGLIRETRIDNESGVPLLKDVPLLGHAFKSTNISTMRTELIVFLSPRIIRDYEQSQAAIRHMRDRLRALGTRIDFQP